MARWTPEAGQHRAALAIAKMGLGEVWGGHGAGVPIGLKKSWQSISCLRRMRCSTKTVTVEVEHGSELDWGHCRVVGGIFRESPQSHRHSFCRGSRDWGQLRALEHLYWMPPLGGVLDMSSWWDMPRPRLCWSDYDAGVS